MNQPAHDQKTGIAWLLSVIGPGIVVAGSVMGSGELINTPVQAAKFGFVLLWAALLSCVIKYFLQVEIARHAMVHGRTTHQALNMCPGPQWRNTSWVGILYMASYGVSCLTAPGMIGALAGMMHHELPLLRANEGGSVALWGVLLAALAIILLWNGVYRHLELLVAVLVGVFSVTVALGVVLIQGTEYRITAGEVLSGLTFSLGEAPKMAAFAVISLMGALGATANELFMYPYWILEKGYHRALGDPSDAAWGHRVRRGVQAIRIDAGVSTLLATVMTAAFFLLGCAILYRKGVVPEGLGVVETISQVFTESFGPWSRYMFLTGAFCTLFSTLVVVAAATGRMFADFFASLGWLDREDQQAVSRCHRWAQTILMLAVLGVFLGFGKAPVKLIVFAQFFGGLCQMPLLLLAICYLALHTDPRARMGRLTTTMLVSTSAIILICVIGGLTIKLWPV